MTTTKVLDRTEIVKNYILKSVGGSTLQHDLNIFEAGIVNSLFVIQLMTFLERQFSIKITMEDLDMDNFSSLNRIDTFIGLKLAEKP